ncbi:MAG: 5'/3'-nucleotidase SurE [Flavobacteriales bacterium]|nr:5'/3'-nucleotidase SurE [Flavobacteriales bacterium]
MHKNKPLILITNDDGINAPGIRNLISVMNECGEVWVVAPDKGQSAMGHAITVNSTLHIEEINSGDEPQKEFSCSGTPADCVKIAISELLPRTPDLCVSGINHGSNSAINVIYSGTMSAAIEAGMEGVASIGFSLLDYSDNANFEHCKPFVKKIVQNTLENGLPNGVILNVNIPKLPYDEIKGVKICRQAKATWEEEFDKRIDPRGRTYFWLTGKFVNLDKGEDTDEWALENSYVSIVPVQYDLTAYHAIQELNSWDND